MNIEPSVLSQMGYEKIDSLGHKELVPFIRTYMKKRTRFSILYYASNILIFALTGYLFTDDVNSAAYSIGDRFTYFSYGLAIAFGLIPIHEYIHVLAYKSQGAKNTSYASNIKKFYFMALADKFVADKREFQIVALAPFVVITLFLIILLLIVNGGWTLTIAGILLTHTAMCSGDFGLLSFFDYHKDKDIVTYDDISNGISYFYGKAK
jgi:Putative zincin peptidase